MGWNWLFIGDFYLGLPNSSTLFLSLRIVKKLKKG
jgi:hypothetical protein